MITRIGELRAQRVQQSWLHFLFNPQPEQLKPLVKDCRFAISIHQGAPQVHEVFLCRQQYARIRSPGRVTYSPDVRLRVSMVVTKRKTLRRTNPLGVERSPERIGVPQSAETHTRRAD
jgi:hypothetical protein